MIFSEDASKHLKGVFRRVLKNKGHNNIYIKIILKYG